MEKDFYTVTPDLGFGRKTITVQALSNEGEGKLSTFTVSGGNGLTKTIEVEQLSIVSTFTISLAAHNPDTTIHGDWEWEDSKTNQQSGKLQFNSDLEVIENVKSLKLRMTSPDFDNQNSYINLTIYYGIGDGGDFVEVVGGDFVGKTLLNLKIYPSQVQGGQLHMEVVPKKHFPIDIIFN